MIDLNLHFPADLSTIHKKFQKKHYPKLTLFVKDVLRVFSNARQLYSEDSQRGRCADTLERYLSIICHFRLI